MYKFLKPQRARNSFWSQQRFNFARTCLHRYSLLGKATRLYTLATKVQCRSHTQSFASLPAWHTIPTVRDAESFDACKWPLLWATARLHPHVSLTLCIFLFYFLTPGPVSACRESGRGGPGDVCGAGLRRSGAGVRRRLRSATWHAARGAHEAQWGDMGGRVAAARAGRRQPPDAPLRHAGQSVWLVHLS